MSNSVTISAVIITFNEEKNISRCLDSITNIADEIIVVDSFSTDNTKNICLEYGVKFYEQTFLGHIEQKNYAANLATKDYILSLDADEALDQNLAKNILNLKKDSTSLAYSMNRFTRFCGHWVKHCGWYPDKKIRLWKKGIAQWGGTNPHDKIILKSNIEVKYLQGDILHYTLDKIEDHIKNINFFSEIAAQRYYENGRKSNLLLALLKGKLKFITDYFFKLGFLDGYYGFLICYHSAFAKYLKYIKLNELYRKENKPLN